MNNWVLWLIVGILSLIGGILALLNPFAATLTAEMFTGWLFVLVGILVLVSAFNDQGLGARIVTILLGVVMLLLGISLVTNPLGGMVALTILAGIMLMVAGVIRIVFGVSARDGGLRVAMIVSGALSILLSVMIFANFPASAAIVLGVYLAIDLIWNGVSLIALSLARRSRAPA
ncbi:hypothetical protein E2L08_12310 [Palleronia sediminis]|uniref:Acid-resistance membrane protein n=1 Tax=Palleronia sediminis TaxID=2547833 RepID=A0A4R6A9Z3_9RHOB|nr:DUF308 domain-containing protein [Palleronia sediminis]TDL78076.1 hypothetical protein E2L08_12310 [Palleronia sediminis]